MIIKYEMFLPLITVCLMARLVTSQQSSVVCLCSDEGAGVHSLACSEGTVIQLENTSYLYHSYQQDGESECCETESYSCSAQYPAAPRQQIQSACAGKRVCHYTPIVNQPSGSVLARSCGGSAFPIRLEASLVIYTCEKVSVPTESPKMPDNKPSDDKQQQQQQQQEDSDDTEDNKDVAKIVGPIVAVVAVVAIGLVVGFLLFRRRRNGQPKAPSKPTQYDDVDDVAPDDQRNNIEGNYTTIPADYSPVSDLDDYSNSVNGYSTVTVTPTNETPNIIPAYATVNKPNKHLHTYDQTNHIDEEYNQLNMNQVLKKPLPIEADYSHLDETANDYSHLNGHSEHAVDDLSDNYNHLEGFTRPKHDIKSTAANNKGVKVSKPEAENATNTDESIVSDNEIYDVTDNSTRTVDDYEEAVINSNGMPEKTEANYEKTELNRKGTYEEPKFRRKDSYEKPVKEDTNIYEEPVSEL